MATTIMLRKDADAALTDKRWEDAMAQYEKLHASGQYSDDATFMTSYALACLESHAYSNACRWAGEAIKLGSQTAYFLRGSAVMEIALRRPNIRLGELRYAEQDLRRVVKYFPDDQPGWKKLEECDSFISDLEQNPPDFFPAQLRSAATKPEILRSRRCAAFFAEEFEIMERASRKRWDAEWKLHGTCQKDAHGPVQYGCPNFGEFKEDPDFPVGPIYVVNRDSKLPGFEVREFLASWKHEPCTEAQEETFELRSLGEIVLHHLGEARFLGFGPSVDEFCLMEPEDVTSATSLVHFDVNTFWTVAILWKTMRTTGVKLWDDEITAMKVAGIPALTPERVDAVADKRLGPPLHQDSPWEDVGQTATGLKESGNAFFKQRCWQDAVRCYEAALKRCACNDASDIQVSLHANLAQCFLNMELFRRAVESASACLQLDWRNQKALFRRALAYEKLRDAQHALADLDDILKGDPAHAEARAAHARLKKALQSKQDARIPPGMAVRAETDWEGRNPQAGSTSWCEGLESSYRYGWCVDCYRLRLDDDCAAANSATRGLYTQNAKRGDVLEDWLVYCKLLSMQDILPADWDWEAVLQIAAQKLSNPLASETLSNLDGDHSSLWKSLRSGAQLIYGDACQVDAAQKDVKQKLRDVDPHLFESLGGRTAWHQLLRQLPDPTLKA